MPGQRHLAVLQHDQVLRRRGALRRDWRGHRAGLEEADSQGEYRRFRGQGERGHSKREEGSHGELHESVMYNVFVPIVVVNVNVNVTAHLVDLDTDINRPQTRDILRQPVLERGNPAGRAGKVSQLKPSLALECPSKPPFVLREGGFGLLLIAWELEARAGLFEPAADREQRPRGPCYPRNRGRAESVWRLIPRWGRGYGSGS